MLISIVIPAFNEEKTILEVVKRVTKIKLAKGIEKEIIVVDDASTDTTSLKLRSASKTGSIRVITHKTNQGKGAAVKTGFSKAKGDILVIQDADLEYDPAYIPRLIEPIVKGKTKVVYGTRLKNYPLRLTGAKRTPLATHYIGNKLLSLATSLIFGTNITDMETGYKVFDKSVLKGVELKSKRFELEPEITAKVLKRGYKIFEIPIKTIPRGYDDGKKITWKDGIFAVLALLKYRFTD